MVRTDTAARLVHAPIDRVYAALVDPDALLRWLPPAGPVVGADAGAGAVGEAGTLVEFRADDVPSGISAADHAAGMTSSLANLAALLEAIA